jgi:hypothetical protein
MTEPTLTELRSEVVRLEHEASMELITAKKTSHVIAVNSQAYAYRQVLRLIDGKPLLDMWDEEG